MKCMWIYIIKYILTIAATYFIAIICYNYSLKCVSLYISKSFLSLCLFPNKIMFCLCPLICSCISWFIVYQNLNKICTQLLCEGCINLNYIELVHRAFQAYYIFLLFCLFILLIFESLVLKLQLKIFTYLLKK